MTEIIDDMEQSKGTRIASDPAKVAAFLAELSALSNRHGLVIIGCGCCGSPYLADTEFVGQYGVARSGPPEYLEFVAIETRGTP